MLNTLIYGAAITCCTFFGMSTHLDFMANLQSVPFLCFWLLPPHILMCHNSYFKDIEGDRAAGLRTLPVLFPCFSLWLGMILSSGWTLLMVFLLYSMIFSTGSLTERLLLFHVPSGNQFFPDKSFWKSADARKDLL